MPKYHDWANSIADTIQYKMDFNRFWGELKEWFILFREQRSNHIQTLQNTPNKSLNQTGAKDAPPD